VTPEQLEQLLHPRLVNAKEVKPIAKGLNAGPGGAVGPHRARLQDRHRDGGAGQAVILVRKETNPDDLGGMLASKGVLTKLGGRTSARRARRPPVRHPDDLRLRRRQSR
jgi:pyruvate,orthophosphate dikinase